MIRARIRVADGLVFDTYNQWKLAYIDSDTRFEAPIKTRDASSYIDRPGQHTDNRTVQDAFDYVVKFMVEAPNRNLVNANARIEAFNRALYDEDKNGVRRYKTVEIFDTHKRCRIVGLPEPIAEAAEFFRRSDGRIMDCVVVEFKIHVDDPALCDFSTLNDEMEISLSTDGRQIFVYTSRPLADDEYPIILRKGSSRRGSCYSGDKPRGMCRYKWQVSAQYTNSQGNVIFPAYTLNSQCGLVKKLANGQVVNDMFHWKQSRGEGAWRLKKTSSSLSKFDNGATGENFVYFGVAIGTGVLNHTRRISNVVYFRSVITGDSEGVSQRLELP